MNECYICFENCNEKCKCKCNLYVHEECIKNYGKTKNFYISVEENIYFIQCPICNETNIYEHFDLISKKEIKKKKCCF